MYKSVSAETSVRSTGMESSITPRNFRKLKDIYADIFQVPFEQSSGYTSQVYQYPLTTRPQHDQAASLPHSQALVRKVMKKTEKYLEYKVRNFFFNVLIFDFNQPKILFPKVYLKNV